MLLYSCSTWQSVGSLILSFLTFILCVLFPVSQAADADLVSNVTYRIKTEAARQLFAVNRLTGAVSVLQALDFEDLATSNSTYTFEVEALDHGGVLPPGTATVIVRITVRPQFYHTSLSGSTRSLPESSAGSSWSWFELGGRRPVFIRSSAGDWIKSFQSSSTVSTC